MTASEKRGIVYSEHMSVVMEAKASASSRTRWVSAAACALWEPVNPPA